MKRKVLLCVFVAFILLSPKKVNAKDIQDTFISFECQKYVAEICAQYDIPTELIIAVIEKESSGNSKAKNGNCVGLMQINTPYHTDRINRLGVVDIYDPYSNILVGVDYLSELINENDDIQLVMMIYNGTSKAEELYKKGKITKYAQNVINRYEELQKLNIEKRQKYGYYEN